jgi:DNA-binding NtrC family response regulator
LSNIVIYIVSAEQSISKLLSFWVKDKWGYNVEVFSNSESMLKKVNSKPDLILLDIMLPGLDGIETLKRIRQMDDKLPVIMLSDQGSIEVAVESLRFGAYDYFTKPIDQQRLILAIKKAIKSYDLIKGVQSLKGNVNSDFSFENIITADEKMHDVFKFVRKVLNNDTSVLICGESGTGRELIASAIHYNSKRNDRPFVVVNCELLSSEQQQLELFGYEKDSHRGIYQHNRGAIEFADGGSIFLKEVGDLNISLQAILLEVIEKKEFIKIGETKPVKTNLRIISSTSKDLNLAVKNKEFSKDLYYKLASFPISIPSLRQRRPDILILSEHFLNEFNKKLGKNIKGFTKKALEQIYSYDWPGNITELESVIERCILITDTDHIDVRDLPESLKDIEKISNIDADGTLYTNDKIIPIETLKEEAIKNALRVTNGNIVEAAKGLRIGRATLYRLMNKYNIKLGE